MDVILSVIRLRCAVVAFCGAWLAHGFSAERDLTNKRREQRINFLITAYRGIESAANRQDNSFTPAFESAVADIQLFGTPSQVELVQSVIVEFAKHNNVSTDDILIELRRDLRRELGFESVPDSLKFLRFTSYAKAR